MGFHKGVTSPAPITNTLPTSSAPQIVPRKNTARVALFNVSEPSVGLLVECFRQFGIEPVPVPENDKARMQREKFDACVLPLSASVASIIELARNSASNSRIVIYGVGGTAQDA